MDGNGRWAKKYKLSKELATNKELKIVLLFVRLDKIDYNIDELSFYVFSTENWRRKPSEIKEFVSIN